MPVTCPLTDRWLVTVTPSMVISVTRLIPGSSSGLQSRCLRLPVITQNQTTFLCCDFDLWHLTLNVCSTSTDLYEVPDAVPPIHAVSSHVATDKDPSKFRSILAIIYNQSQLAERKHVARYWSISAVPVSAHPSPFVITTKLVAAIYGGAVVSTR